MLDLNITLLFQLANFFVAIFLLNILLIKPVRAVLRKRQGITDGMARDAGSFESKAEKSLADYDQALRRARQEAVAAREAGRNSGLAEQQGIIGEAQKNARSILDDAGKTLKEQSDATLSALRGQVSAMAQRLSDKLLKG